MPRFTKLEAEALIIACTEIRAGDVEEYMNNGAPVSDPPKTSEERYAVRLAKALDTAYTKLLRGRKRDRAQAEADRRSMDEELAIQEAASDGR